MAKDTSTWSSQRLLNWLGPNVLLPLSAISLGIALALASPPLQAHAGAAAPNALPQETATFADIRVQGGLEVHATAVITQYLYFPIIYNSPVTNSSPACGGPTGESYANIRISGDPTSSPAEIHPDLNLGVRGYTTTTSYLGLTNMTGQTDKYQPPQLWGLFTDNRTAAFSSVYRVFDWDWPNNQKGDPIAWPEVTLAGLQTAPGEVIHVPPSWYDIGLMPTGYEAMVLYTSTSRLTITYTRLDSAATGYVIHLEDFCVDPNLLALYQQMNNAGRFYMPALFAGQGVGRARTNELKVAIRDTGSFMDPRSRKDWWQGR